MHYYSYKYHEVISMKEETFNYLYECMSKAIATDRINLLEIIAYPHIKPENQKKVHKKLYETAQTDSDKKSKVVTFDDLKKFGFEGLS